MTTFKKLSTLLTVLTLTLCLVFAFTSCELFECKHVDNDKDHKCDECSETLSECADATKDHKCDVCGKTLTECADADKNHKCDVCNGNVGGECADSNDDHNCDYCGAELTDCADADNDHLCDVCGETVSECADADNDHYCDVCDNELSQCADPDKDHNCDVCGIEMSQCSDIDPKDHVCDYCGGNVGGQCADSETDYDHACDYCGNVLADCADGDDADHNCDVCAKSLCADGEDADHNCDVCQMNLCDDADKDHACDVCKAKLCYDSADRGHTCDVCGDLLCKDADSDKACDVCGDPVNAETLPVITVYVEGANCTINGKTAVRFYGSEEDKSVVPSYTADQYVIDLWVVYNGEGTKIAYLENGDAFVPTEGTYYIAPIFVATNFDGIFDTEGSVDVSDGTQDKIDESSITPEWADVDASKKLFIFGSEGHTNNVLASSPAAQLYLTTDPTDAANVVLMVATRNGATGGIGNTVIATPLAAGSKGDSYLMSFDYYLDHNCSSADSTTIMVVKDSEGNAFKIGVIVPAGKSMASATTDTATPTEGAFRFQSRHYNSTGTGVTGNDGKEYKDSAGSEKILLSSDTWYTFSIEIKNNMISTYWSLRGSDERALVQEYDFSNFSISERNLVAFEIQVGLYNNSSLSYFDNIYFGKQHKCVDADSNHACDECEVKLCADGKDLDHLCDVCGDSLCYEGDIADHYCDGCGAELSKCADEIKNHYCDICGKGGFGGDSCVDADPKTDGHNCNYCGANLCVDVEPKNHVCDVCEAVLSECTDADNNHDCDYCGKEDITVCVDENKDHICDICKAEGMGEHADAAGDKDHLCDYGCGKDASECVDTDTNYVCDECEKALCYDLDKDHICDIEAHKAAGEKISECVDEDKNHVCDYEGCKAAMGTHADGETVNHVCDYCGKYDATWCTDVNKDHACDLEECGKRLSYCADANADNKCDYCDEHVCSDANADRICDSCEKYIISSFETEKIESNGSLAFSNVNYKSATEYTSKNYVELNGARDEGYNASTHLYLAVDPSNAINTVLAAQSASGSGLTEDTISDIILNPTTLVEGGDLLVLEFDYNLASSGANGKNTIRWAYNYSDGSVTRANATYTTNSNASVRLIADADGSMKFDIGVGAWVRIRLVCDNTNKKIYTFLSTDNGATYTQQETVANYAKTTEVINSVDITFIGWGVSATQYFDNIVNVVTTAEAYGITLS